MFLSFIMTTNAPYYQIRGHGFQSSNNGQSFGTIPDEEHGLSSSMVPNAAQFYPDGAQPHNPNGPVDPNTQQTGDGSLEESHILVELLEAATSAASQATEALGHGRNPGDPTDQLGLHNKGKRKRVSSPTLASNGDSTTMQAYGEGPPGQKRVRYVEPTGPTDPQLSKSAEQAQKQADITVASPSNDALANEAHGAGVHSAAALFRRSSNQTTKKYTRPPMSKLFMSLQLTPENFLHLQAQAKSYMLDPAHPDRQTCVGNRGKGDTDMVKLRLFHCVRDFLEGGAGEQFFGENVEKPGAKEAQEAAKALGERNAPVEARTMVWPYDGNKIITLVTPLLRRMVTNERQRQYAIETRKSGSKKKDNSTEATPAHEGDYGLSGVEGNVAELEQLQSHLDPALPMSPAQSQTHHAFSTFPTTPITTHYHPNPPVLETPIRMESYGLEPIEQQDLPDRIPILHTISLFLSCNGAKLRPNYSITQYATTYSFSELQKEIRMMVQQASAIYPRLRHQKNMPPELLRGLAAAATEFGAGHDDARSTNPPVPAPTQPSQPDHQEQSTFPRPQASDSESSDPASDTASTRPFPPTPHHGSTDSLTLPPPPSTLEDPPRSSAAAFQSPSSSLTAPAELPRFVIKALTSRGLVGVRCEEEWNAVKEEVGFAVWAEGVLRVVVELEGGGEGV